MWLLALLLLTDSSRTWNVPVAPRETLRVTDAGAGEPVVLLPGLFGSAYGFRNLIPQLIAAGYRVVVVEPLGIGGSSRPERADYSLTAQADRIATVLDTLGLGAAVVVAHGVGASMAYRLAYRRPDRVRGIVALDGGPAEAAATPEFRRAMLLAPWTKLLGGVRLIRRKIRDSLVEASGDPRWVTEEVVAGYTAGAAADLDATLKAYLGMAHAREPERLRDHLGAIRCPVRLVTGGTRHPGAPAAAEVVLLRERLVMFAVDSVPGAGHFLYEERPAAVVAAVKQLSAELAARAAVSAR
jgi:pimeloyl-ACP methyl ester carboxylesterase